MKPLEFMKAVHTGLAAHFGKMAAHHEKMAAHETEMSQDEATKAKAHKAMADHCKAFGKADVAGEGADKAMKAFGAGMEDEHDKCGKACESKASTHTKKAALHKAAHEHHMKMAAAHTDSEKALKAVQDDPGATPEAMQKAVDASQAAILDGVKALLKELPVGVTKDEVATLVQKAIDALPAPDGVRVAGQMPGLHIMDRTGGIVDMSNASVNSETAGL